MKFSQKQFNMNLVGFLKVGAAAGSLSKGWIFRPIKSLHEQEPFNEKRRNTKFCQARQAENPSESANDETQEVK